MTNSRNDPFQFLRLALFVVVPFIVYAPALTGEFVYDDIPITVVENPALRGEVSWLEILTWDRPLREFTYMLDHALWGYNPIGYHLQNLFWHIANTLILYFFLVFLGFDRIPSFLIALIFSVHPINTESVAWISGRKELLCLLFELATCYLFTYFIFHEQNKSDTSARLIYMASMLTFVLAHLSKQVAVVLPFLMASSCWLYARNNNLDLPGKRLLKASILPFLLLIAFLIHGYDLIARLIGALDRGTYFDPSSRDVSYTVLSAMLTPFATFFHSIWLLVWPMDLTVERAFSPVVSLFDLRWVSGAVLSIILGFFAIRFWKTKPVIIFALGWIVLTWGPVSGVLPISYLMADRYLYIPCVGFCIFTVLAFYRLCIWYREGESPDEPVKLSNGSAGASPSRVSHKVESKGGKLKIVVVVLVCLLFSARTFIRAFDWRDEIALWEAAARSRPNCEKVYINLGNAFIDKKQHNEAFDNWNHALALNPDLPQVWLNMGKAYNEEGNSEKAESCYRKALELLPTYGTAHYNLAVLLEAQGKNNQALDHFREAAKFLYGKRSTARRQGLAYYQVARLLYQKGDYQLSQNHLIQAEKLAPTYAPIHLLKGLLYKNDIPATRHAFMTAIQLNPNYSDAYFNLGVLEWQQGNNEIAEKCWVKALELNAELASRIENVKNSKAP